MTTTETEDKEPVIDESGFVLDPAPAELGLVVDPAPANLAVITEKMSDEQILRAMKAHGMIVPISPPASLRQLYAMRQKMYAAILDENDYLWIVKYKDGKYGRQYIARNKADAEDRAKALSGDISAKPIKSGVQKLAEALGITARCVLREERSYIGRKGIYCEYEAKHEHTGKIEQGVAFCGVDEKSGKISVHDMLTTADTRAYNRAVLRLAAFGDVSAEEIVAGLGTGELPEFVPEASHNKIPEPLPEENDDDVVAAMRAYGEALADRDPVKRFLPEAKQDTLDARVLRALARRGDQRSAQRLGTLGLHWEGTAQDSPSHQPFDVGPPKTFHTKAAPTEKEDTLAKKLGDAEAPPTSGNGKEKGWDLGGDGKKDDDNLPADLPERHEPKAKDGIPQPNPTAEVITVAQAKKVSHLMVEVLGSKDAARAWLKAEAHVEKSTEIHSNQYEIIMSVLTQKKEG